MTETLRILLVEDDEDDYVLARDRHDVSLFDYRLGEWTGLELVREAVAEGCETPIILLTGRDSRALDLDHLKDINGPLGPAACSN